MFKRLVIKEIGDEEDLRTAKKGSDLYKRRILENQVRWSMAELQYLYEKIDKERVK